MILRSLFFAKKGEQEERRGYHKFTQLGMMYWINFAEYRYCSSKNLFFFSEGNSLHTVQCPSEMMADHYSLHQLSLVGIV